MRDSVAVEHVVANVHRQPAIARPRLFDPDSPGWAGAFLGKHCMGHATGEFIRSHEPAPTVMLNLFQHPFYS
jgi:hypothetical protein